MREVRGMHMVKSVREAAHDTSWDFLGPAWWAVHITTIFAAFMLGRSLTMRAMACAAMEEGEEAEE